MVASTMHNPHYLPERGDVVDIKAIGGNSLMSSQKQPVLSVSSSVSVSESLVAVVQMLVNLNEEEFLTSLTPEDRRQLAAALDALRSVIGEEENHLFTPLMDFIGNLIEADPGEGKKAKRKWVKNARMIRLPRARLTRIVLREWGVLRCSRA